MNMIKVAIYCRASKEKGVQDKTINDQLKTGLSFCNENGYDFKEYIDDGYSGTTDDRLGFQELLADIIDGSINLVWVMDDSRIQRDPEIRYLLNKTLKDNNVEYYTHVDGAVDLYNPETNLMGGVLAEFNKYFVSITKMKVKSVLRRRALQGKGWGIPPYGWILSKDGYFVQNHSECEVVKRIYKLSLEGIGVDRIAKLLNEEKVPTRYNGYDGVIRLNKSKGDEYIKKVKKKDVKWAGKTVLGILNNEMFFGKKKIKDVTFDVDELFTIDYWSKVNYNLKNNNSKNITMGGKVKYQYLLRGLIKCGKCGKNYTGKTRKDKKDHFYYCMSKRNGVSCGNRSINIDHIEALVWNSLFHKTKLYKEIRKELGSEGKRDEYKNDIKDLKYRIQVANKGKNNVLDSVVKGILTMEEVTECMYELRKEIEYCTRKLSDNKNKLSDLTDKNLEELNCKDKLEKLSFIKKHELVQKFVKDVNIHWVETRINGVLVRYYKVVINYNYADITHVFTNGYGLDFSIWYEVKYDYSRKHAYFNDALAIKYLEGHRYGKVGFGDNEPFIEIEGYIYPEHNTMAPYGNVDVWIEDELKEYYGGMKRYNKFKTEFEHKLNSNVFLPKLAM